MLMTTSALPVAPEILNEIFKHSERFARIEVPPELRGLEHLLPVRGRLGSLETLTLPAFSRETAPKLTVFAAAPRLHTLLLNEVRDPDLILGLPVHQIRKSVVGYAHRGICRKLHENLPSVADLTIVLARPSSLHSVDSNLSPELPPPHRATRKFVLHCENDPLDVLGYLNMPLLSHLELLSRSMRPRPLELRPAVAEFFNRSRCALHKLVLSGIHASVVELVAVLHAVPTLRSLTMSRMTSSAVCDHLFRALIASDSDQKLYTNDARVPSRCSEPLRRTENYRSGTPRPSGRAAGSSPVFGFACLEFEAGL
ncbi:hypothetical protein B0H10DRAFT_544848 [Mycena sp. CBHHK59/15]|nr:hypothetical protein B0H10DRAFT_544848 [Mycena sp. CBHHK59/15]